MPKQKSFITLAILVLQVCRLAEGSDWPQWRFNAQRGAVTNQTLSADLSLHWQRELPAESPAWPATQAKLQFDTTAHPVVNGQKLLVNSTVNDSITALDTRTGEELWRFYAGGPVRFAPIAADKYAYFVSDDGHLYCLELATGKQRWRYNGGPSNSRILGNERLISSWPARGGPVLQDGKVFFAASIWPFMGIFIHAVDAETGEPVWVNSGDGTNLTIQPHGAPSFATVVPQGHLVASENNLIVPGGRSVPAVYDLNSGRLQHFNYHGKHGGHHVFTDGQYYFVGGKTFGISQGKLLEDEAPAIAGPDAVIFASKKSFTGKSVGTSPRKTKNRRGKSEKKPSRQTQYTRKTQSSLGTIHLQTDSLLWTAKGKVISAYELKGKSIAKPFWTATVTDDVAEMIAADDRLFAITRQNQLICFGPGKSKVKRHSHDQKSLKSGGPPENTSKTILSLDGTEAGYAVIVGANNNRLIDQLLNESNLHLIVLDRDGERIRKFRDRMQAAGLYGNRISAHANLSPESLPAYLAQLIVFNSPAISAEILNDQGLSDWYRVLRPYGGKLCLMLTPSEHARLEQQGRAQSLPGLKLARLAGLTVAASMGPLPDTDDWSHQYGNAGQTGVSLDQRVKAPLGVLWFGGPSHEGILPRHGHGPTPQVAGGRIIIEGADFLRCLDAYTGRQLWQRELKSLGAYYNNTKHFPGAGEIGSNYVSTPDHIYVVYGQSILKLNASTGETRQKIQLPENRNGSHWGHISVWEDFLVATSTPVSISTSDLSKIRSPEPALKNNERAVIHAHAKWRYLAGKDPAGSWGKPSFDDSDWKLGQAGFGYGDGDDNTKLKDMEKQYTRVFLRHTFDREQLKDLYSLSLLIRYDDAFIAYLNDREIARSSLKSGRGANADVESHEADEFEVFRIKNWRQFLQPGENTIAIEGHNVGLKSSDFTLDPYLVGQTRLPQNRKTEVARIDKFIAPTRYASGSRRLVVLNRHTGRELWHRDADFGFRHNNITVGANKVFCIDRFSDAKQRSFQRRGIQWKQPARLYALNLMDGSVAWETNDQVFGTFLNYSQEHDALVQGGSLYRDRASDESDKGIVVYRGRDGKVLWEDSKLAYGGPLLLWKDQILTNGNGGYAIGMKTGKKSGWSYDREYGCNTAHGCQNLLTFRSGAAGFYDMLHDAGTGNLGGFRSSCTNNLIPANGILAAPDYTRTCNCAYQNQTSLALIHQPSAEYWTFGAKKTAGPIGLNFGAPGDRRDKDRTLWVDYPSVGGKSIKITAKIEPQEATTFRRHASTVLGERPWITGSGLEGIREIRLGFETNSIHTLNLFFLEPTESTERNFDVIIQGKIVLPSFSPAKAAGGVGRGVIRSFEVKPTKKSAVIELRSQSPLPPVISGLEILQQES
ncbi:MAG: PQQ-binding-like beta-propeller repeat protein [Pirellulaceae bacterium]|nr:PQQ-binding-like beta-propeller repeat protein [Pirellulaceae bacterium]